MTEKLTREKAIEASIAKWEYLAETGTREKYIKGITKSEWPFGCSLCALANQDTFVIVYRCRKGCPYYQRFGRCFGRGKPFAKWEDCLTINSDGRKRYAAEFLAQLRQLQSEVKP